jgi:uncharacterized protein (DUF1015 family)
MAEIIPFRGILYNTDKIKNLADIIAPPFDVISEEEQENYHRTHQQNMIWLTLGRTTENDTSDNNRYTRAADYLKTWLSENILLPDEMPAFYLTSHQFPHANKTVTRYGLIALVGLVPFEEGVVLPHEKTFSKVKAERLELIKACRANLSPIFSLYSDKENQIMQVLLTSVANKLPDVDFIDHNGQQHSLWRITDQTIHRHVSDVMQNKRLFIADGHHRYETALRYKQWLAENTPDFNGTHPANYVMMYLCGMEDPGVVVLPAHRMLNEVPASTRASLISKASDFFDITTIPYKGEQRQKNRTEFLALLKANTSKNCLGVFMKDCPELYLLTLKPNVMERMFGDELADSLRNIDVTVLTRLLFMEILGFDQARLDNENLIAYTRLAEEAIDLVEDGKHDITFILNPTKIEQVRHIAAEGLIMPRKATYFYPKVITGQVLNRLINN